MDPRSSGLGLSVEVDGARAALAAFRDLPKEASLELRRASLALSRQLAGSIAAAGRAQGAQAALLAGTVKAKFDRTPAVKVGGTKPLGRHGTPAGQLLVGSEFGHGGQGGRGVGSRDTAPHGFKPHRGRQGYWIFPTLFAEKDAIAKDWLEVADVIARRFATDPPGPAVPPGVS